MRRGPARLEPSTPGGCGPVDTVGESSQEADAEIVELIIHSLRRRGLHPIAPHRDAGRGSTSPGTNHCALSKGLPCRPRSWMAALRISAKSAFISAGPDQFHWGKLAITQPVRRGRTTCQT